MTADYDSPDARERRRAEIAHFPVTEDGSSLVAIMRRVDNSPGCPNADDALISAKVAELDKKIKEIEKESRERVAKHGI
jgi:hypothetical protein